MTSPLIIVTLAYMAGILLGEKAGLPAYGPYLSLAAGIIVHAIGKRRVSGLVTASLIFLSLGAMAIGSYAPHPVSDDDDEKMYEGMITGAPEKRPGGYRVPLRLRGMTVALHVPMKDSPGPPPFAYGDVVRARLRLRRPKNFGNPGEFDFERSMRFQEVAALASVRSFDDIALVGRGGNPLRVWLGSLRERIGKGIDTALSGEDRAVMRALVLGEQGWISPETRASFTRTGTVHILVVSGLHLAVIAWASYQFLFWIMKRSEALLLWGAARKTAACISLVPVALYAALSGGNIPVQRAFVMVCAFIVSFLVGREREIYTTMGLAALSILAVEPQALFSISFRLSFLSVLSIIYLSPRLAQLVGWDIRNVFKGENPWPVRALQWAGAMLVSTVSAGVGLSPVLALYFNQVPILGLIANLVVIPVLGTACVSLGLVAGLSGLLSSSASAFFYTLSMPFLRLGLHAVHALGALPLASLRVTTPTLIELVLMYVLIVAAANVKSIRGSRIHILVIVILLLGDWGYWRYKDLFTRDLRVTFLSVGHGDAALIEFPGGKKLLVDGGDIREDFDLGERVVAPYLWWRKIPRLDYAAWSHGHSDHIGGLPFVVQNFSPGEAWGPPLEPEGWAMDRLDAAIKEGSVGRVVRTARDAPVIINGVRVEFLGPEGAYASGPDPNMDDGSLVMRVVYGDVGILFTGDIKKEGEKALVDSGRDISAAILKLAHHGGGGTTGEEFIARVHPRMAVASTGRRRGFPSEDVLARLASRGIRVLRTDLNGAVTIKTDGRTLDVVAGLTHRSN